MVHLTASAISRSLSCQYTSCHTTFILLLFEKRNNHESEHKMGKPGSIPQPPGYPLLGNLFDIDMELPLKSLYDLAEKHGQ